MEKKIKRGVSIYSYSGEYGRTMDLEDCFKDMHDMGATGIEILANSHIDSYPVLSDEYLSKWKSLCETYQVEPAEYGHWIDTRLYKNRNMTGEEARRVLINDFQIANALGFHVLKVFQGNAAFNGDGGSAVIEEDGLRKFFQLRYSVNEALHKGLSQFIVTCSHGGR